MIRTHQVHCPVCRAAIPLRIEFGRHTQPTLPQASVRIVQMDWSTPGGFLTSWIVVDDLKGQQKECLAFEEAEQTRAKWLAAYPFEQRIGGRA